MTASDVKHMGMEALDGKVCDLVGYGYVPGVDGDPCALKVLVRTGGLSNSKYELLTFNEDPEDGYRSCLGVITASHGDEAVATKNISGMVRIGPPLRVHFVRDDSDNRDLIKIVRKVRDEQVTLIEVGTDRNDDYYPNFVSSILIDKIDASVRQAAFPSRRRPMDPGMFDTSMPAPSPEQLVAAGSSSDLGWGTW